MKRVEGDKPEGNDSRFSRRIFLELSATTCLSAGFVPDSFIHPANYLSSFLEPARIPPKGFPIGVNTHVRTEPEGTAKMQMALAGKYGVGFAKMRTDFRRSNIEPEPNNWNFEPYDIMVEEAARNGMQVVALVNTDSASMPKWLGTNTAGKFEDFVRTLAEYFKGRIKFYEIANEENTQNLNFLNMRHAVHEYGKKLKRASKIIRKVDSNTAIISSGLFPLLNTDLMFLKLLYGNENILGWFDYIGYHAYSFYNLDIEKKKPNFEHMEEISRIARWYGDSGKLAVTEFGYPDISVELNGITPEQKFKFVKEMFDYVLQGKSPVAFLIYYELVNSGNNEKNFLDNFGLYRKDQYNVYFEKPEDKAITEEIKTLRRNFDSRVKKNSQ